MTGRIGLHQLCEMKAKVFGIGFHKTGTKTLKKALEVLGYNVCGARKDLLISPDKIDFAKAVEVAKQFDAFQDNPWPLLYREMDAAFPGSKFILTTRSENAWIRSVVNHFGKESTEMRKWIYGFGSPQNSEEIYIERFQQHHRQVSEYFKSLPDSLLIVSWENGDGWEKICSFLNLPVPNIPFPHENKRLYTNRSRSQGIRKLFSGL